MKHSNLQSKDSFEVEEEGSSVEDDDEDDYDDNK